MMYPNYKQFALIDGMRSVAGIDINFKPEFVPLSKLKDNKEHCEKVGTFLFGEENCFECIGAKTHISFISYRRIGKIIFRISNDGYISGHCNHFALIDLIRSLGYEPEMR